jgi:hypothetical protein
VVGGVSPQTSSYHFFLHRIEGRWCDEIDDWTPSMARGTRAIPKTYHIVPAWVKTEASIQDIL